MGLTWMNYLARNRELGVGLALLLGMIAFAVIGGLLVDPQNARPLSARVLQPPSWALPFGSDRQGRNLFAVITTGTLLTLRIGLIAGILGVGIGAAIAFVAAYYGGWVDSILRSIVDIGLTVPNLMILIVVALTLRQGMTVNVMALVIASLAWLYPARTIRSQVLTLRERAFVQIARLSGAGDHREGADAEFAALSHGLARRIGIRCDSRLDRARCARPRRLRGADAWYDALLGQLHRRGD